MNRIDEKVWDIANDLFLFEECSIREVCKKTGIARETAHRIQKCCRAGLFYLGEPIKVFTGIKADGTKSFYMTNEWQDQWGKL